jgi:hypothetical protein
MVLVCAPSRLSLQPDPVQVAQLRQGIEAEARHGHSLGELVWMDFQRECRRPSWPPPPNRPELPAPPIPVVRPSISSPKGAEHV